MIVWCVWLCDCGVSGMSGVSGVSSVFGVSGVSGVFGLVGVWVCACMDVSSSGCLAVWMFGRLVV